MKVDVYLRSDKGMQIQFLFLPEGHFEIPQPAKRKLWFKVFNSMDTEHPVSNVPVENVVADVNRKGFCILRVENWSKDWTDLTEGELADLSEPDTWHDKWNLA